MLSPTILSNYPDIYTRSLPEGEVKLDVVDTETKLILHEAELNGIQYSTIPNTDIIALTFGDQTEYIRSRVPSTTHSPAEKICRNKALTKAVLQREGINTPNGYVVVAEDDDQRIGSIWDSLKKPLVLKPTQGSWGKGIIINISDFSECLHHIHEYFKAPLYVGGLLLEEMFSGDECRIVATREKMVAAMKRIPASVRGDGKHSISELIEQKNLDPIRNISQDLYPHIQIDADLQRNIERQGFSLESVPAENTQIRLRTVSNIMAGGEAVDMTEVLHPSIHEIVKKIVLAIPGLSWTGIDFMSTDFTLDQTPTSYMVIELGEMPEFAMHDLPMVGKSRGVAKEFLRLMFPHVS